MGSCTNYGLGTDCTGVCKSCDSGSCENTADGQDYQTECDGLNCSTYYISTGTEGADDTEECYDRADEPAGTHNCEGDGTCRDVGDDCPGNSADTFKYDCAACKYISGSNCTGTTLGSCTNYGLGTDCTGVCKSCSGGSCVNTANGQDYQTECDGLNCSTYYIQVDPDSPSGTNSCYDRANEPAGTHNCEGNGTCRDLADDCPGNSADTFKYSCAKCKYVSGCSGTDYGSCGTYGDGTDCGANQKCYSGSCKTKSIVTYYSEAGYDGQVESGGEVDTVADGIPRVYNTYRAFLSFYTEAIPDAAIVTSATLHVHGYDQVASTIYADCLDYGTLSSGDYGLAPIDDNFDSFVIDGGSEWEGHNLTVPTNDINKTGRTQFRFHNNGVSGNSFRVETPERANSSYLSVTYYN